VAEGNWGTTRRSGQVEPLSSTEGSRARIGCLALAGLVALIAVWALYSGVRVWPERSDGTPGPLATAAAERGAAQRSAAAASPTARSRVVLGPTPTTVVTIRVISPALVATAAPAAAPVKPPTQVGPPPAPAAPPAAVVPTATPPLAPPPSGSQPAVPPPAAPTAPPAAVPVAAGPAADLQAYAGYMRPRMDSVGQGLSRLGEQSARTRENPGVALDPGWRAQTTSVLDLLKATGHEMQDYQPVPASAEALNATIRKATTALRCLQLGAGPGRR